VYELERTARETYGQDWETRGVHALSAGAVALAALFPLAAWLMPGAAGTAAGAVGAAGAGTAGAGAAGAGAAGTGISTAGSASAAGKIAAGSAIKAFFGTGAGLTAAAAGTVVVVGAGALTLTQVTRQDPEPRPSATAKAAATIADVRPCVVEAPGAVITPSGVPAKVTLPAQVEPPKNTAVYGSGQGMLIGPAGAECKGSVGANAGSSTVGNEAALVEEHWQGSIGGIRIALCEYFPDSAQARRERAQGNECTSVLDTREDLPTGAPGFQAVLTRGPGTDDLSYPSPLVKAELAVLTPRGLVAPITCTAPAANAGICTSALTYWFIQHLADSPPAEGVLDRAAESIAEFVDSTRI
jgi:hypothetical protein